MTRPGAEAIRGLAREALLRVARAGDGARLRGSFDPEAFAQLLLGPEQNEADAAIARLRAQGHDDDAIIDGTLAPAARILGRMWEDDRISFLDVSLGIANILRLFHRVSKPAHGSVASVLRSVLFTSLEGESHTLGVILATESFRQHGWEVDLLLAAQPAEVVERARDTGTGFVGLTVGRPVELPRIAALVRDLHRLPNGPRVLLGGPLAQADVSAAAGTGVDAVVPDLGAAFRYLSRETGESP